MTPSPTLLQVQSRPDHDPEPVRIPFEHAAPVFDGLTSETARTVLTVLAEEPRPASAVAEAVGTSTQNAFYHINNLHDGGLLTVVDTWYSEKRTEMDVYAARYDPIVLTAGAPV